MRSRYPSWLQAIALILVPVLLVLLTYANFRFIRESPGGNELRTGWTAAKLWLDAGISPYDPDVRNEVQESIYGRPANSDAGEFMGYFSYPLPAILVYVPFSFISFDIARAIWMTLVEAGLLVLVFFGHSLAKWTPNRLLLIGLFLFSLVWYHGASVVVYGSLSVVSAILIIVALLAIQRTNDWIAGLMLSFSVIQPNLSLIVVLLVCLWAISVRRWQLLVATIGFHVGLLGLSLVLIPGWPFEWIRQSIELISIGVPVSASLIVGDAFPHLRSWLQLGIPAVLGIFILVEWIQVWGKNSEWFTWTAGFTIAVSILFEPHASTEDYVLLLPVTVMIFGHWVGRWGAPGKAAAWFSMLAIALGLWFLFFSASPSPFEPSTLYFPVPIFCILGLFWIRWWVTRSHHGFPR